MAIFGKNGFVWKQEVTFAKKLLVWKYEKSGTALPDEAAILDHAKKIVEIIMYALAINRMNR